MKWTLSLCCNDWRNGLHTGKASAASIERGSWSLSLEGPNVVTRELGGNQLRIGRLTVPFASSPEWYGNWCWNAYEIDSADVRRIVTYLACRKWGWDDGAEKLVRWFDGLRAAA